MQSRARQQAERYRLLARSLTVAARIYPAAVEVGSRRGNPMWLPGGGRPHRAAPTKNDCPTHHGGIDTALLAES